MNKILNSARKLVTGLTLVLASSVFMTAHAKTVTVEHIKGSTEVSGVPQRVVGFLAMVA